MAKEQTPEVLQRIEQLEQSKIIIDNKISRLQELRTSTQAEINKLGGMPTYALPDQAPQTTESDTYIYSQGETYPLTVWLTFAHYAEAHQLGSTEVIDEWISKGLVPANDLRTFADLDDIRLIRDKLYI